MELRHLRYFLAVAEQQHVRRAAERLHIAQPALTRQIRQLEEELGCALFDRHPQGMRLTAAGQRFLQEARQILDRVGQAVAATRRVSRGELGVLRLGFLENASWSGPFPQSVLRFRERFPDIVLELTPLLSRIQLLEIQEGGLDGGFCYLFEPLPKGCEAQPVRQDRVVLAVPSQRGWRGHDNLRLKDLAAESFIAVHRESAPAYLDTIAARLTEADLAPRIVQEVVDESTLLSLVATGMGVGFVNSANARRKPDSVDLIPIMDLDLPLILYFVWRADNSTPPLARFREVLVS